jgi:HSP20 family protein
MKRKGDALQVGQLAQELLAKINTEAVAKRFIPKTDVWESASAYHIHVCLPGIDSNNISLEYHDEFLVVSGERPTSLKENEIQVKLIESDFGYFQRRIKLNDKTDITKIKARLEHGVLMIEIPKHQSTNYLVQSKVA